ncbi:MAG: phytanoyl-CoA dioxygenase family protein [Candidatus Latescibacteria bacterium]|nr:phytanoyl-CoA dioxygenase family protein [Candidatus Latescibacterota bacterium]
MSQSTEPPIFRIDTPPADALAAFHRDGYVAFPEVFTEAGLAGLTEEILDYAPVREFLSLSPAERAGLSNPSIYFIRPWNDRGVWSDRLIDAPLVTALLRATLGPAYHFCHSALNVALRGAGPIGFHQDHHHWFHTNAVNLAEREKGYIQILYYPNGFTRGDRSLSVIPGSHRIAPTAEVTPEKLLSGAFNHQAQRELKVEQLELPPGSMVYLNARMFHAVEPKPLDSPQPFRLFVIDIFKEAGPPHRYTQEIPAAWLERAGPERKTLFDREPYSPECWTRPVH